jgi:hypothetical protein
MNPKAITAHGTGALMVKRFLQAPIFIISTLREMDQKFEQDGYTSLNNN